MVITLAAAAEASQQQVLLVLAELVEVVALWAEAQLVEVAALWVEAQLVQVLKYKLVLCLQCLEVLMRHMSMIYETN